MQMCRVICVTRGNAQTILAFWFDDGGDRKLKESTPRVERRRHIDRRRVLIVAMERHVLRAKVGPDSAQEFRESHGSHLVAHSRPP
jgi:hypothetical protein